MTRMYRWPGGLAVLVAAAAVGLAACSSGSGSPQIASLPASGSSASGGASPTGDPAASGSSATAQGSPTKLLDEWAACMRSHGDPGQSDPTIDTSKVIHVIFPASAPKGVGTSASAKACASYINAAAKALGGGSQKQNPAALLKFSQCMRANGIPDFPDPTGDSLTFNRGSSSDLNPKSSAFQNAAKVCTAKTGVHFGLGGTPAPGTIVVQTSAMAGKSGFNG